MHDDHLADALRTLHPLGATTAQVSARVDTLATEVLRLRTLIRTLATVTGCTLGIVTVESAYLLWAAR